MDKSTIKRIDPYVASAGLLFVVIGSLPMVPTFFFGVDLNPTGAYADANTLNLWGVVLLQALFPFLQFYGFTAVKNRVSPFVSAFLSYSAFLAAFTFSASFSLTWGYHTPVFFGALTKIGESILILNLGVFLMALFLPRFIPAVKLWNPNNRLLLVFLYGLGMLGPFITFLGTVYLPGEQLGHWWDMTEAGWMILAVGTPLLSFYAISKLRYKHELWLNWTLFVTILFWCVDVTLPHVNVDYDALFALIGGYPFIVHLFLLRQAFVRR